MAHSLVQSPNESSGQLSPQPSIKRKKLDDDDLNGSKKARTRVRFVPISSSLCDSQSHADSATLVENAIVASKRYVQNFNRRRILISYLPRLSATARFPAPTYASVHKINTEDALNYIFSVWLVRCPNCVKHIPPASQIKISTFVLLDLSISLSSPCLNLHQGLVLLLRMVGPETAPGRSPPVPMPVRTHKPRRMTLAAEHFKAESGMELAHQGVSHPLQYYNR